MPSVLAFDYDGTIARNGHLDPAMRPALEAARHAGLARVLVTGRSVAHLLQEFPDVLALFDRVVAENGAVLLREGGRAVPLAAPVDARLADRLEAEGIDVVRGQVLLALEARHEEAVRRAARELGLDVRLSFNRASLMVLPAAISKAAGLSHALASLGVAEGQAVAFGDAENDVEMLAVVALGVAVGDAVPELKLAADVTLEEPGPEGVAKFVLGLAAAIGAEATRRNEPEGGLLS